MRRPVPSVLRLAATGLAAAVLSGGLAGCGLLPGSSSDLEDALEVLPADVTTVTYVGRAAAAERAGVDDVETGADDDELGDYLEAVGPTGATRLTIYLRAMQQAAFTDLDLEWEVTGIAAEAGPFAVWKADDDLDLDEVADDLVDAGYEESEVGGERAFSVDLDQVDTSSQLVGDRYPATVMGEVLLVPDEHLIVTGGDVEAVLEVVNDDEDSLVDAQRFEDVVGAVDDVEYARLEREIECAVALGGVTAEQLDATTEEFGLESLRRPDTTGFLVHGDDAQATTVLGFEDDDTAEADAEARGDWLEDGTLVRTRQPLADLADWDVEADGNLVRIDQEFADGLQVAMQVALAGDGFTLCAP